MIAVCIPAYEEVDYLPGLLRSLTEQTVLPDEIVIADSSSSSETQHIASDYGARVVRSVKGNVSLARNYAFKNTVSDIIVFADADNVFEPNYIEIMSRVQPGKIMQGTVRFYDAPSTYAVLYAIADYFRNQPVGSGMALTRGTFNASGWFNESIVLSNGGHGEEADLANRVKALYGKCYVRAWETTVWTSARRITKSGLTRYLTGNPWDELGVRDGKYVTSLRRTR